MARLKTSSDVVILRQTIAKRLRELRVRHFGENGIGVCARRVGVPYRSWYNYERGIAVPGEVILRFIDATGVEPIWLLHGQGPMYQPGAEGTHQQAHGGENLTGLVRDALTLLKVRPRGQL
jgi:hypothetical protein